MYKLLTLFVVSLALSVLSQKPTPCVAPVQLHYRMSVFDYATNHATKFSVSYDFLNRRQVWFQAKNFTLPGQKILEYLRLNNEHVIYVFDFETKVCTKSVPGPFEAIGIRANATFEDEFYIGGPGEAAYATQWSDRIPGQKRESWIGDFTMKNCYPVRTVYITDNNITNSRTIYFYDILKGIPNPNVFIPPKECDTAKWAELGEDSPTKFIYH